MDKDENTYSKYEKTDMQFYNSLELIKKQISSCDVLKGRTFPYCFKDIYNGMKESNNQVYTRSLHAEENAFLQISKYGGKGVKGGNLFTTASPCELCAKKAYQLGIHNIYYIDPYPGISLNHILTFGENNNPKMKLFQGAIGVAYILLYKPYIALKDELELMTNINCKKIVSKPVVKTLDRDRDKLENLSIEIIFRFESREKIRCERNMEATVKSENLNKIEKYNIWTGSTYEGIYKLESDESDDYTVKNKEDVKSPYGYVIEFKNEKHKGDKIKICTYTRVEDEEHIMNPYIGHIVTADTNKLVIKVMCPQKIIGNVREIVYADMDMSKLIKEKECKKKIVDNLEVYEFVVEKPNMFYSYSIEWKFI